jgi:hypothetical protein
LKIKPILALLVVPIFVVALVLPAMPAHAVNPSVTLNNGFATYVLNSDGSSTDAYLKGQSDYMYLWYWAVNFTYQGTTAVFSHENGGLGGGGWSPMGKGQFTVACTTSCNMEIDELVASVPGTDAMVWGLRFVNPTTHPITNLKFYGYQDADLSHGDEGHYATSSWGPLKFIVYENGGNTPSARVQQPYYGYTFAGVAADAHDLNPSYSAAYGDVTHNIMNGANYYFSDGGSIARDTIGTIPPGGSVVVYWVLGMSPGNFGATGLQFQLLMGSALATSLATPPEVIL